MYTNNIIYRFLYETYHALMPSSYIAKRIYKKRFGKKLNLNNPKDLNEKINWMKFNSDTSRWTDLADKYLVRNFVKERGLSDILIPLYAKWDIAAEMSFDNLPKSFILKTNHGSGEIYKVEDKDKEDIDKIRVMYANYLKESYGKFQGEPHYMKIKPCVIAEELLAVDKDSFTTSLVDYKIWCFDGKPYYIWACYSRTKDKVFVEVRDKKWNWHPEKSIFTDHYRNGGGIIPKPKHLDRMLEVASILSKGFPQVRVDLYEHNDKVYFGEMTFTSNGGYMDFYTQDFLDELGNLLHI